MDPRLDSKITQLQQRLPTAPGTEKVVLAKELLALIRRQYPLIYLVWATPRQVSSYSRLRGYIYCYCTSQVEVMKVKKNYRGSQDLQVNYAKSDSLSDIVLLNLNRPVLIKD